jgi:DNA-binding HxlR family transcriptional regulator
MWRRHMNVTDKARVHLSSDCGRVGEVLSRIGDKWSVMVVMMLRDGSRRFSELKREIGGVSQRMLTLTLRGLERDGIVTRTIFATVPPRVDYELTELGRSLLKPVFALGEWTFSHLDDIDAARRTFDEKISAASEKGRSSSVKVVPRI